MQLRHAAHTDPGKTRDHNEDSYGVELGGERPGAGALFVVCDGVGGFASGEVASDLGVKTIISRFYAAVDQSPEAALTAAFQEANRVIYRQGGGKMGTTTVAAFFRDDVAVIANVGDCRAILVRNGQPRQLTRDHSFVAEQVAAGMLTEEQARESSYRHIITRAMGHRPDLEVDIYREPLLNDDVIVLCSDGLHGQVEPEEIALAVTKVSLDEACRALIKLANDRGGPDNITIVAVKVTELTFPPDMSDGERNESASSTAKTARLSSAASADTQRMAAPADDASERRVTYGPPPAVERRSGIDRRTAPRPVVSPPAPTPTHAASHPVRSFLLWIIGLLLLAAIIGGGYYYAVLASPPSPTPLPAPLPVTQTPPGGRTPTAAAPTLIPTGGPSGTSTP